MKCINCGKQIEEGGNICMICKLKFQKAYEASADDSMRIDIKKINDTQVEEKKDFVDASEENAEENVKFSLGELKRKDIFGLFSFVMRFVYIFLYLTIGLIIWINVYKVYLHIHVNKFVFLITAIIGAFVYLLIKVFKIITLKRIGRILLKNEKFTIDSYENRRNKISFFVNIFKITIACVLIPISIYAAEWLYGTQVIAFTKDIVFDGYSESIDSSINSKMENVKWSFEKINEDFFRVYVIGDYKDYKNVCICFEYEYMDYNGMYTISYDSIKMGRKKVDVITGNYLYNAIFSEIEDDN